MAKAIKVTQGANVLYDPETLLGVMPPEERVKVLAVVDKILSGKIPGVIFAMESLSQESFDQGEEEEFVGGGEGVFFGNKVSPSWVISVLVKQLDLSLEQVVLILAHTQMSGDIIRHTE